MSSKPRKVEQKPKALLAGSSVDAPTQEEIRQRAFEMYCARGQSPQDPAQDWLDAERELRMEHLIGAGTLQEA